MKVIVIPPDAPARIEDVEPTLDWLQATCGGYVEAVGFGGAVMWIGEDAKRLGLPPNATATSFLRDAGGYPGDYVAGTAVLTGPADRRGEVTPVPAAWERIVAKP